MRLVDVARRGRTHGHSDHRPGREWIVAIARRLDLVWLRVGCQPRPIRLYQWSYRQGWAAAAAGQPATTKE